MPTLTNDPTESEATDFAVRWAQAQEAREAELDGYGHGHGPDDYTTEYSRADEELAMRVHREELERVEMEAFQRVLVSH
jgi:glutamate-1-semialdehyde aminotransferase